MFSPDNHLYEFEPFVLDARSRILLKDGVTVRLSPKAFETLLVLVHHGAEVVDKEQLLKEVWPDTFVEEGSLSRNIHELRKALGDDSSEPRFIETIPKRGYRFVAPLRVTVRDGGEIHPAVSGDATVIEKHTFARVLSEEFEGSDVPAEAEPLPAVPRLALPGDAARRKRKRILAATGVAALLLASSIGTFVYLKGRGVSPAPVSRAKSTLVRLTYNAAFDAGPTWSPDGTR